MQATSSQRPNLRPTSFSVPIISNPHPACSATEASLSPLMRAMTAWKP